MKKTLLIGAMIFCCCANAQNTLDEYTKSTNTYTEIASGLHGLSNPHDLDFVPGRPGECWVLNKEAMGGSMVLIFNIGQSNQLIQHRRDSHNEHFMARGVAMAFGDKDYFGTAQEIKNTSVPSATFMGPALWNSDTTVFARMHQSDWDPAKLLGSHIDMLHQSPFGMGIAHDNANVYWYFDGYNSNICKYDFNQPHGVGEDDHSDGKIYRYTDVTVTRVADQPSHMVVDKANSWLYIVDAGSKKVIRVKTNSGTVGATLTADPNGFEPLAEYKQVTGATKETVVASGLTKPVGVDYRNGRLIVSDNATGTIHLYNVTANPPVKVGEIITGGPGVMGVKITNDNKIYYVNATTNKLYRIDNPNVVSVDNTVAEKISYSVYPNPAQGNLNIRLDEVTEANQALVRIFDATGKQVHHAYTAQQVTTINTTGWASGIYHVILTVNNTTATQKVVVQ